MNPPANPNNSITLFQAEAGGSPALIARGFGSGQSGSEQFEMTVPDNKVIS